MSRGLWHVQIPKKLATSSSHTSLCPFLYQTSTLYPCLHPRYIHHPPLPYKRGFTSGSRLSHPARKRKERNVNEADDGGEVPKTPKAKQKKPRKPKKSDSRPGQCTEETGNERTSDNPFEEAEQDTPKSPTNSFAQIIEENRKKHPLRTDPATPPPDASTLTGAERKAFEKIYRAQERDAEKEKEKLKKTTVGGDDPLGEMRPLSDMGEDGLDKVFDEVMAIEHASELSKAQKEQADAAQQEECVSKKRFPSEFHAVKRVNFNAAREQPREESNPVEKAAQYNLYRIKRLFATVQEDYDLWRVLEMEVFSKMRAANKYLEAQEEAKMGALGLKSTKKGKRRSRKEAETLKALLAHPKSSSLTLADLASPNPSESSPPSNLQIADPATTQPNPMQLLTPIYGSTLLQAAYMYRTLFPRSPYAMALLPKIKEYGPISYVLGASTALYNETLYLKWKYYRDLDGCGQLVEEMVAKGLKIDQRTLGVMQDALNTKKREQAEGMLELRSIAERTNDRVTESGLMSRPALQSGSANDTEMEPVAADELQLPPLDVRNRQTAQQGGMLVGTLSAGWWRLQGNRAGWQRWRNAHQEAMERWKEDLLRVEEEKRSSEDEKAVKAEAPSEEDDYAEPEVAVLNPEDNVVEEEVTGKLAAGGAG